MATSIITVEEQLTGWYTVLRQAKDDLRLTTAYDRMTRTIRFLSRIQVISYTITAASQFQTFRKARLKVKTMDLRIACGALDAGARLITRNRTDFELVPGLEIEDWSIA